MKRMRRLEWFRDVGSRRNRTPMTVRIAKMKTIEIRMLRPASSFATKKTM